MEEELYSFDTYKGYNIFVIASGGMYYGEIQFNGTNLMSNIKSNSGSGCLEKCKSWVDKEETPC